MRTVSSIAVAVSAPLIKIVDVGASLIFSTAEVAADYRKAFPPAGVV